MHEKNLEKIIHGNNNDRLKFANVGWETFG